MIVIECPNCRNSIQLTDLRAGRFLPKCPHCGVDFELIVGDDLSQAPRVARLDEEPEPTSDFVFLSLPESDSATRGSGIGEVVRDALDRLRAKVGSFLPARLPRGIPRLLDEGHYVILRRDGQGFYGPMFVAIPWCGGSLKTVWMLPPDLGRDPYYASRWVAEMVVSAELIHPNLEPFDAVGESHGFFKPRQNTPAHTGGLFYAVKERSEAIPAAYLTRSAASPAVRQAMAAAIMLQVARGLKYAHDQGISHRDIRPENVVVDGQGYVRVINFGLDSHSFLDDAERQRKMAVAVDKRDVKAGQAPLPTIDRRSELEADLVGLGRAWIALATDQPDVMTLPGGLLSTRAETLNPATSAIARKLLAPEPEGRFTAIGDVVQAVESELGIWSPAALGERESLHDLIRATSERLAGASNLILRDFILRIAAGIWGLLLVLFLLVGLWRLDLNFLLLGGMTAAWIAALADPTRHRRPSLILKLMDAMHATSFAVLVTICVLTIGLLGAGLYYGYLGTWVFFGILSFVLAMALEVGVGRAAASEWRSATQPIARRIANLRLSGIRDETLREWFDSSKCPDIRDLRRSVFPIAESMEPDAVDSVSERGSPRGLGLAAIGEAARRVLRERVVLHRDRRHRSLLTRTETDRLVARGVNRLTAIRRARRVGKAVISAISDWRLTQLWNSGSSISLRADLKKNLREEVWRAIDEPERILEELEAPSNWLMRRVGSVARAALGRLVRLAAGVGMLVLFAIWLDREGIVTWTHVTQAGAESSRAVGRAIENLDVGELRGIRLPLPADHKRLWGAWNEPLIHRDWSRSLSGINLGLAGLILVLSAFFERFSVGLFAIFGSMVILVGPVLARAELGDAIDRNTSAIWLIAGLLVAALGFVIRPRRRPT